MTWSYDRSNLKISDRTRTNKKWKSRTESDWSVSSTGGPWIPGLKRTLPQNKNGNHDKCADIISRSVLLIGCLKFWTRWLLWHSRAIFEYKNGQLHWELIKWILWNAINKIKVFLICISLKLRFSKRWKKDFLMNKLLPKWINFNAQVKILRKNQEIFISVLI